MSACGVFKGRTWVLELPGRPAIQAEWRTANRVKSRGHDKRLVGELQDAAIQVAREVKLPLVQRARIVAEYQPPANRHYDPSNLAPSAKAYVDGIVRAGVLSDDASEYLIGPDMRAGYPYESRFRLARMVLHITELPPLARVACVSAKAAAAVVSEARCGFGDPAAPGEYLCRADGKTVVVMHTDPFRLDMLVAWAFANGLAAEPSSRIRAAAVKGPA